jgi:hypothetical protein
MAPSTLNSASSVSRPGWSWSRAAILGASLIIVIQLLNLPAASARSNLATRDTIAQAGGADDDTEISPAQLEKYVAVYKAMQRDRSLTVEAAAAENGMTLEAFRQLEGRVQRDEAALQRARDELQASAKHPSPAASP